jgi:hypothetical protein
VARLTPVVTICTTSLTFSNSAFFPHSVFMCFGWIWEQTAVISLYSINWLVFITESECFLCGTSCFYNAVWISISLYGRAVAQASRRPPTTETGVRSYISPCAICGAQCGNGAAFFSSRPTSSFPYYYHSVIAPYSFSSMWCSYQDGWAKPRNFPTSNTFSEVEVHWIRQYYRC